MYRFLTIAAPMFAIVSTAHTEHNPLLGWSGNTNLGYAAASGNSDTENLNVDLSARRDWLQWAIEANAGARYAESNNTRSEENYQLGLQGERKLSDIDYLFLAGDYTVDNFSGYDYQYTINAGYGRHLLLGPIHSLKTQIGLGWRESETTTGQTESEMIITPEANYAWQINENVTFTQDLSADIGSEYTVTESETGLESKLTENLYAKASYTIKHTSDVPANTKQTDTYTGISLGYKF